MKKIIAIYFSDPEPMGYPFGKSQYLEIYKEIISKIESHGIDVFIVRGDSYISDGRFKRAWQFIDGNLKESKGEIRADLIFNRDDKNTIPLIHDCKIINKPEFDQMCVDKIKTFEAFPDISPKTAYIHSYQAFLEQIGEWQMEPEEMIVLKKNFETEGRGIFIVPVSNVKKELYSDWNDIIIQEFLDSSIGIPNITNGLHDLRVTVINGRPINSFLRVPKEGSYLANVSQGGQGTSIDLDNVPKDVIDLVCRIDEKVKKYFPAIYAADFINSPKGYKLLELNSRPGVQHPDWSKTYKKFNDAIIDMLAEAIKE
ncbi:MAG: hypothetical protein ABIC82_01270 [bacterium]